MDKEEKATKLVDHFYNKYGAERCEIILKKIMAGFNSYSLEELIKIGEKWHYFNLYFNEKISYETMHDELKKMGYS